MITLPLIYALQAQPLNGNLHQVHTILNGDGHTEEDIMPIVDWVVKGPGIKQARDDAYSYAARARTSLNHFPHSANRDVLDELIDFVITRNH